MAATLLVTAVAASAQEAPPDVAITHVNVVDVRRGTLLPNRTVLISEGRIRSVFAGSEVPDGVDRIDGTGKYLTPGLWDMHVHLRTATAPTVLMPLFVAHGVTGVRDMNSDCNDPSPGEVCAAQLRDWQSQIEDGALLGPRLLALSSFSVNPTWDFDLTEARARELVHVIRDRGVDFIKVYYRLSPDGFRWMTDEASRVGLSVSGHIPLRLTAAEASDAGLRSLEHARDFLFDCFPGSADFRGSARSQNPPIDVMRAMVDEHDAAQCDEVFQTFVRNDTWYVPTHVTRRMDAYADDPDFRNDPRSRFVAADVWEAWNADADRMVALDPSPEGRRVMRGFYERGLEITGRAHAAGVPIVLGTDAGDTYVFPGSSVQDELGELVKAGLTPAEALSTATTRAAEFLDLTAEYGSVEAGKRADLLLLTANPLLDIEHMRQIEVVFLAGRPIRQAELMRLLDSVETRVSGLGSR